MKSGMPFRRPDAARRSLSVTAPEGRAWASSSFIGEDGV